MRAAPMLIALAVLAAACTGDEGPPPRQPATVESSPRATESRPRVLPTPWAGQASRPRAGVIVIEVDSGRSVRLAEGEQAPLRSRFDRDGQGVWVTERDRSRTTRYSLAGTVIEEIPELGFVWESPDGSGRQYAFRVAGSNDERLVVLFEGQEVDVDWLGKYSPDGARLLALEYGDDGYDLIVLDLRVGTATTVAANTRACGCGDGGSRWLWSPSGRYVLHDHLDDQDGHSSVDLIDTTTNTTTTLIEGEGFSTGEWFPFSDMLLLQSARDGVWLVDVESGVSTIIEATPVARIDSRGQFVYWTKQLTAGESEIVVRELKTGATVSWPGEIINVFPPAAAVVWTSDGPAGQVRHIDCNGVVAHHPALPAGGRCVARVDVGAWSPDGLLFAYTRIERTGGGPSWSVYILDPASGQETMLAEGLGRGGEIAPVPMWNRQGTHIVVTWPGESPL